MVHQWTRWMVYFVESHRDLEHSESVITERLQNQVDAARTAGFSEEGSVDSLTNSGLGVRVSP